MTEAKKVLHVGCGFPRPDALHPLFRGPEWKEIRLDINPDTKPDFVQDMRHMPEVADASMDGVWSSHNLEHLFAHEVPQALKEFHRVLKDKGRVVLCMPDIQRVAAAVAEGRLEEPLYRSPSGPISALDVLFGHTASIAAGNHYMAHKTAFTAASLGNHLIEAGFCRVRVVREGFDLHALAEKDALATAEERGQFTVQDRGMQPQAA